MKNGLIIEKKDYLFGALQVIDFVNLSCDEREIVRRLRNHDDVRKWMYNEDPISEEEHGGFIESLKKDEKNYYWLVREWDNHLGVFSFNRVDFRNRRTFYGMYVNPFSKKRGIGSKIISCAKIICKDVFQMHSLRLEVFEENERAISFYLQHGLEIEGKMREFVFRDHKWKNVVIMGMLFD